VTVSSGAAIFGQQIHSLAMDYALQLFAVTALMD
jgi:hypothetical protein